MTYFELVSYLDKIITLPVDHKHIEVLQNVRINLEGDRYFRFISQINYLLTERLRNFMDKIVARVYDKPLSKEELTLELNELINEINYIKKIIAINLIKSENRNEFTKSIIKNNNEIVETLLNYYQDEEYKMLISGYLLKEEN